MTRIGIRLVLAVLALMVADEAPAVRLSETGQALIYPYYSASRKADGSVHNTYLTVTNTAADAKVMRVRIAEGRNHRAALFFNLYLPPGGTWTAAIVPGADAAAPPKVVTNDKSCTNPAFPAGGEPLRNFDFTGANADGAGTDVERLGEGFVEVVEMATLQGAEAAATVPGSDGTPANCALLRGTQVQFPSGLGNPTGGLTGVATIINVTDGYAAAQRATALAEFTRGPIYRDLPDANPSLDAADPISNFTQGGIAYRAVWASSSTGGVTVSGGALAVSSVLAAASVSNDVILDRETASSTEWVATMPTKRFFVTGQGAVAPFSRTFTPQGACETVNLSVTGRDAVSDPTATPLPCWGSVVMSFQGAASSSLTGQSPLLASRNLTIIPFSPPNGIVSIDLSPASIASAAETRGLDLATGAAVDGAVTVRGLPVVGFAVSTFNNGQVPCGASVCKSTFAATVPHVRTH